MRDFAFVQTAPGRVFVGWGPFEQLPFRRPERPAFFITDFFLDDPHPWRHPHDWEELSMDDFAARFEEGDLPEIEWESPSMSDFAPFFESAISAMRDGTLTKIVPVMFEDGRFASRETPWGYFLARLSSLPPGMFAYGYSYKGHGLIGATPELLFQHEAHGYRTMALAGTRPVQHARELLSDAKEQREHRLVVDDIVRRLAPFGNVEIGPLGLLLLPSIAHLITPIFFQEMGTEKMTFTEMVRRLHPTAALGVSPRNEEGERWLREADRGVKRRSFGAPFGMELADRSALALVSIRNVQWSGDRVRVGSGAGLLVESRLEREFEELRQKREQVKHLFGIERHAWATSTSRGN
ncbi:MAG TPA: chorismate-binding protein [Thermoanaerobaculia bacterium]